jgi:hypothetical protein
MRRKIRYGYDEDLCGYRPTYTATADRERYSADSGLGAGYSPTGRLTAGDVGQIVDTMEQLDWVQFVKQQMNSEPGEMPGEEGLGFLPSENAHRERVSIVDDDEARSARVVRYASALGCDYDEAAARLGITKPRTWAGSENHGRTEAA